MITSSILLISACSSESDNSADDENTIKYAYWDKKQEDLMEDLVEDFNEENPDINVELELTPFDQYFTKLDAAASGGSLPDVFWMNGPNIAKYANNDMIEPIDDYISEDDVDLDNYPDGLKEIYQIDDETYALPKDYDSIALWYNKELFDDADVDYPDESWDWEDMIDAAEKITDESEDIYGIAASIKDSQATFLNTILMNDGYILSDDKEEAGFDDPNTKEGLQKYYDLIDKYDVSPTHEQMETTEADEMFESGSAAMIFQGSYMIPEFKENDYTKENADVAVLPKMEKRTAVIHGLGNVISKESDNKDASWKFVEYLSSEEAAEIQAEHGIIPAYEGAEDAWLDSADFNLQAFLDMADASEPLPVSENTEKWNEIMENTLAEAWSGESSIDKTSEKIDEEIEKILSKEN